jgi:hypothetical protein
MEVSSNSIKVATVTVRAITHGLMTGFVAAVCMEVGTGEATALANGNLGD